MTKEQREEGEGADVPLPPSQAHLQWPKDLPLGYAS
jgi:hypothetical protein